MGVSAGKPYDILKEAVYMGETLAYIKKEF
jgi:hypothetical protein